MSVAPNGGRFLQLKPEQESAALADVSSTEWRHAIELQVLAPVAAALADVSSTEWRSIKKSPRVSTRSCTC